MPRLKPNEECGCGQLATRLVSGTVPSCEDCIRRDLVARLYTVDAATGQIPGELPRALRLRREREALAQRARNHRHTTATLTLSL